MPTSLWKRQAHSQTSSMSRLIKRRQIICLMRMTIHGRHGPSSFRSLQTTTNLSCLTLIDFEHISWISMLRLRCLVWHTPYRIADQSCITGVTLSLSRRISMKPRLFMERKLRSLQELVLFSPAKVLNGPKWAKIWLKPSRLHGSCCANLTWFSNVFQIPQPGVC